MAHRTSSLFPAGGLLPAIGRLARRPSVVLLSLVGGITFGLNFPDLARPLSMVGEVYVDLLRMIILPFMMSAIIFSLRKLMADGEARHIINRLLVVFALAMLVTALVGLIVALVVSPGRDLPTETMQQLGKLVEGGANGLGDELPLFEPLPEQKNLGVTDLILRVIPGNIFAALADGDTLKTFVFALLFGFAVSRVPGRIADALTQTLETVYHTCQTLTHWFNYPLPVVLFCMLAAQMAKTGLEPMQAMVRFLACMLLASAGLIGLSFWVLKLASGRSWRRVLQGMREPLTMAVATRSSQACMPVMIESLVETLGYARVRIELLVPLGTSLLRVGPVLYYVVATLFIAQLYGRSLSPGELGVVMLGSILAGFASTGMSGLLTVSLVGLVCGFLGLPFEAAMALFVAIEPGCDILRTLMLVVGNCAVAALVCGHPTGADELSGGD